MYTVSPLEWATPVLYLRAEDARLFTITPHAKPPANQAAAKDHLERGRALRRAKRYPEAEAAYREAIRLDPGYALAQTNLSDLLKTWKRERRTESLTPGRSGLRNGWPRLFGWTLY